MDPKSQVHATIFADGLRECCHDDCGMTSPCTFCRTVVPTLLSEGFLNGAPKFFSRFISRFSLPFTKNWPLIINHQPISLSDDPITRIISAWSAPGLGPRSHVPCSPGPWQQRSCRAFRFGGLFGLEQPRRQVPWMHQHRWWSNQANGSDVNHYHH